MTTLQTVLEVIVVVFAFAAWTTLAVFGATSLFRPQVVQAYYLKQIEQYQNNRFGRWLTRWYPFYASQQAFMKTRGYLWYLRFMGVAALFMAAIGIFTPLLSLLVSK